jgi:hypothetical protein
MATAHPSSLLSTILSANVRDARKVKNRTVVNIVQDVLSLSRSNSTVKRQGTCVILKVHEYYRYFAAQNGYDRNDICKNIQVRIEQNFRISDSELLAQEKQLNKLPSLSNTAP